MADDLGYGDLGSYNQQVVQTPNLDRLAEEGLRFTQVYAGSPVCAPSRSALMTGQHTGHTTVRGNTGRGGVVGQGGREGRIPIRDEDVTVAEVLKSAGYVTGMTGKWGLGEPETTGLPTLQGFDEWYGYLNQRRAHSYYPEYLWHNEDQVALDGNRDGGRQTYSHDLFTEFALDFVTRYREEPFFLYVPYTIPHARLEVPDLEPYTNRNWEEDEIAFAAMVTRMDRDIGRLLALLKDLEIDDRTIVFFCSDNGAAERWDGRFDSSGPLRGQKRDLYEGGIRTPMIVRFPGKIQAGTTSDAVWYFPDVLPTLADLAGGTTPAGIDGVSVLPTLMGDSQDLSDRVLYWEFYERGVQQAVRWNNWKGVKLAPDTRWELYDLSTDVGETTDIAGSYPDIVATIAELAVQNHAVSPHWPAE